MRRFEFRYEKARLKERAFLPAIGKAIVERDVHAVLLYSANVSLHNRLNVWRSLQYHR